MNQISLVIHTFEQYPMLVLSFILLVVGIGGGMYGTLLQPKLQRIEEVANSNTARIIDIKDDLNVKHYEMKSDMKEFFHSIIIQSDKTVQALVGGVTDQIKSMNANNEKQHGEMFDKADELSRGYHENEKRIAVLENK